MVASASPQPFSSPRSIGFSFRARRPLWPVPPIVALVGVGIALRQQKPGDLLTVAAIFAIGLIYYYGFLAPRQDRYWRMSTDPTRELERLTALDEQG